MRTSPAALIEAVINEDVQKVEQLLTTGSDPNATEDSDKVTPLHFVAQKASEDAVQIARLLIKAGADVKAKTLPDGHTPLEVARLMSTDEMVAVLSGIEPNRLH